MANLRLAQAQRAASFLGDGARPSSLGRGARNLGDDEEESEFFTLKDTLLAPVRGVEAAFQDIYGLADTLTGDDLLGDWDHRVFGESRTTVGGVVEGISNFAIGFIPIAGQIGKASKLSKLAGLGKLSKSAEKAARAAGKAKTATAINIGRAATAGAITDALVWDGHEARLSDLLVQLPALQNPVTAYLASNEDDSELEGRLKNVLEGAGLGAMVDAAWLGMKRLKVFKNHKDTLGAEKAGKLADEAVPDEEIAEAVSKGRAGDEMPGGLRDDGTRVDVEDPSAPKAPDDPSAPKAPDDPSAPKPTKPGTADHADAILASVKASDITLKKFKKAFKTRTDLVEATGESQRVDPRDFTADELDSRMLQPDDLNLSHLEADEAIAVGIRAGVDLSEHQVAQLSPEVFSSQSFTEQRDRAVGHYADMLGLDTEQAVRVLTEMSGSQETIGIYARNYMGILGAQSAEVQRLARIANDPASSVIDAARATLQGGEKAASMAATAMGLKGLRKQMGRSFGFLRDMIKATEMQSMIELDEALKNAGGPEHAKELLEKFSLLGDDVGGLLKAIDGAQGTKMQRLFNEYWLNSLLSGGRTQTVNMIGNGMMAIYRPLESMMGATMQYAKAAATGDSVQQLAQGRLISTFAREMTGLSGAFTDAMQSAQKTWKTGDAFIDPHSRTLDDPLRRGVSGGPRANEFSAEGFGIDPDSAIGASTDWLGKVVNFPTRLLGTSDEFFKQLNYRSTFRAGLVEQAMKDGISADVAGDQAYNVMERVLRDGQAYSTHNLRRQGFADAAEKGLVDEAAVDHAAAYTREHGSDGLQKIHERALGVARETTFTTPLREGSLSKRLQSAVIAHPALRLIMPFVRTPVNIAVWAGQRLDVPGAVEAYRRSNFSPSKFPSLSGEHSKMLRQMTAGNARDRAEATGRMMTGIGAMTFFGGLASSGRITGRGPSDPEQRRLLENAGWMPYSVRVNVGGKDRYVQYARLDPFATLIGMYADIADYGRYAAEEDQGDVEQLVMGSLTAAANNFTNKTYLTGLSRFVEVLQQPDQKIDAYMRSFGGSLVPSILNQSLPIFEGDTVMKDVNTLYESVASRIPGLSGDLAPVRNVLGEPVSKARSVLGRETIGITDFLLPVAFRTVTDSVIDFELQELKHGFTPPKKSKLGLNLTQVRNTPKGQSAYDRWSQLHGIVKVRGKTMRVALRELIRSRDYQRLPVETTQGLESPRIAEVNRVIQRYRAEAWNSMLRDFPQLAGHEKLYGINRQRLSKGLTALEMAQRQQ